MRILPSARKHGISDDDMHHAIYNAINGLEQDKLYMLFGPDRAGNLLEVGVVDLWLSDPVIVHAMPLRDKFSRYL